MSITYCECVFVAWGIQQEMRVRCIVICGLSGYTKLCHLTLEPHDFRGKNLSYWTDNVFWFYV